MWAQDEVPDFLPQITPPSPTAASLGNYGNIPVGEFTGAANINIPLLTYKTKNLAIPISLYYGSNGIRVDETEGNVGLGWNINMGGVITRTVRDREDEIFPMQFLTTDISGGIRDNPEAVTYFQNAYQDYSNTEVDVFSFNVAGLFGRFVIGPDGIVLDKDQKVKIEQIPIPGEQHLFDFLLIADNGIKYHFTSKENTTFRTTGVGHGPPISCTTAWYLTKIVHPLGDEIYLTYAHSGKHFTQSQSQTLSYSDPQFQSTCTNDPYSKLPTLSILKNHYMDVGEKRLVQITSNISSFGGIDFEYDVPLESNRMSRIKKIIYNGMNTVVERVDFGYLTTQNDRVFLNNITFNNPTKNYQFEYIEPENFPQRLSKSQDHWGFYNGVNNDSKNLIPIGLLPNAEYNGSNKEPNGVFSMKGMLKRIIYPTKGYTEFEYEPNTYWGTKRVYPPKQNVAFNIQTEIGSGPDSVTESVTIYSPVHQIITMTGNGNYNYQDCENGGGEENLWKQIVNLRVTNLTNSSETVILGYFDNWGYFWPYNYPGDNSIQLNHENSPLNVTFIAHPETEYKIELTATWKCTYGNIFFDYYSTNYEDIFSNIETGGVRIKSTNDFDNQSSEPIYRRYYYAGLDNLERSSGVNYYNPYYFDEAQTLITCGETHTAGTILTDKVISSSNIDNLIGNKPVINYQYVSISEGGDNFEKGGVSKEFIFNPDIGAATIYGSMIYSAPPQNTGWDNGLEKIIKKVVKDEISGQLVIVEEKNNNYFKDIRQNSKVASYYIRTHFENHCWLDPLCLNGLSIAESIFFSHWSYLSESTTIVYDTNGENPIETTTTYTYDSPDHLQLTSQTLTNSDGKTHVTSYQYPPDLIGVEQSPYMQDLTDANRIAEPVITETFIKEGMDTKKTSENHIKYGKNPSTHNLLLPVEVHTRKGTGDIDINTIEDRKVTYTKYAPNGNILEYRLENGTPVCIIWGYNEQYPIAKVEGVGYSVIENYIQNMVDKSEDDDDHCVGTNNECSEAALRKAGNDFRDLSVFNGAAVEDVLITTYTYDPLIGVTSITHPNRSVEYYHYDVFGRLKEVKNAQGEVIRKMQYNYKPQP